MTQVTITKDIGGHKNGATIEVSAGSAQLLIDGGHAEAIAEAPKAKQGTTKSKAKAETEAEESATDGEVE